MLPGMNEKFEAFIAPARTPTGGLLLLGSALFLLIVYTLASFVILALFGLAVNGGQLSGIGTAIGRVSLELTDTGKPASVLMLLTTFLGMAAAVLLAVRLFHDRGIATLLGPRRYGPLAKTTLKVLVPLLLLALFGSFVTDDPRANLPPARWLLLMIPALPLLLIQVSAEELIFRGYLMQELAVRFRSRWIWFVLPAMIFGSLHLDTDTFSPLNAGLVVVSTTLFGLIAADVTVRTGSLIPAITLHFGNNLLAMMILSLDGSINGLSLFVTGVNVNDGARVTVFLLADVAVLSLIWCVWMWLADRRTRLQSTGEGPTWSPDRQGPQA